MDGIIALFILGLAYVLIFPIVLAVRLGDARRRIAHLEEQVVDLQRGAMQQGGSPGSVAEATGARPVEIAAEPRESGDERDEPGQVADSEGEAPNDVPGTAWGGRQPAAPPPVPERAPPPAAPKGPGLAAWLAENWMIWVGGLALGLSAVFLFRYAVDQGWLTPLARVVLGVLFGGALLSAAEWVRARPPKALATAKQIDFIPPVLTGTGVFAVFVSLYAGHALFGLLGPATAFVALGLVAYAGLALALRHGPVVALVGLVTGYAVPALVTAPEAQAVPLFLYLGLLTAGCLAVMVWRKWWWFSLLTLAGAFLWPVLWLMADWSVEDQGVLSAYGLGLAALFALLATDLPLKTRDTPLWAFLRQVLMRSSGLGFALSGVLLLGIADTAGWTGMAFAVLGVYAAMALALGAWRGMLEALVPIAALIVLAALLGWPQPDAVTPPGDMAELGRASGGTALWRYVIPLEFTAYFRALIGFGALFGLGGFAGLRRGPSPVIWAGVSAGIPVLLFVIGYSRIADFEVDLNWGVTATMIALLQFGAAWVVARGPAPRRDLPLGLYAAATTAALSLAIACVLREAWLTVSLAAEVLALAWIWSRLPLRELRALTLALTVVVIVRLVANPAVLDYQGTVLGTFHWVIYGYGLPALALWLASRLFRAGGDEMAGTVLEIAAAGFAFLTVALQIRLWTTGGNLKEDHWSLFDISTQVIWGLVAAGLLVRRELKARHAWAAMAGAILLLIVLAMIVLGSIVVQSPLFVAQRIGGLPVVNLLGLAYLLPALMMIVLGTGRGFEIRPALRGLLLAVAGGLVFLYLTLETRHMVWGEAMVWNRQTQPGNGEIYAYSVVWIGYALALLGLSILLGNRLVRQASMAVLMAAVAKVFLYDMSDLTGLYRVASFLGLGVALIGIARIYQRFAPPAPDPEPEDA